MVRCVSSSGLAKDECRCAACVFVSRRRGAVLLCPELNEGDNFHLKTKKGTQHSMSIWRKQSLFGWLEKNISPAFNISKASSLCVFRLTNFLAFTQPKLVSLLWLPFTYLGKLGLELRDLFIKLLLVFPSPLGSRLNCSETLMPHTRKQDKLQNYQNPPNYRSANTQGTRKNIICGFFSPIKNNNYLHLHVFLLK